MSRGFAAVGLENPKNKINIGGAMRAAMVFGADLVVVKHRPLQQEWTEKALRKDKADVPNTWRHVPTLLTDLPLYQVPIVSSTIVGVEIVPGARSLVTFCHPEAAFYLFGPEDGSLSKATLEQCDVIVQIPTPGPCLNLASCVAVLLYDRMAKGRTYGDPISG